MNERPGISSGLLRVLALVGIFWALVAIGMVWAYAAEAHEWYTDLRSPEGLSCCGEKDCEPAQTRMNDGDIEVLLDGQWWRAMDPRWYITPPSQDGEWHVCRQPTNKPGPRCTVGPLQGARLDWDMLATVAVVM